LQQFKLGNPACSLIRSGMMFLVFVRNWLAYSLFVVLQASEHVGCRMSHFPVHSKRYGVWSTKAGALARSIVRITYCIQVPCIIRPV